MRRGHVPCARARRKDFGHIAALTALRSLSFEAFYHVAGFGAFEQLAGLTALQVQALATPHELSHHRRCTLCCRIVVVSREKRGAEQERAALRHACRTRVGWSRAQELDLGQDTLLTEGVHAALQCLSHLTRLQVRPHAHVCVVGLERGDRRAVRAAGTCFAAGQGGRQNARGPQALSALLSDALGARCGVLFLRP